MAVSIVIIAVFAIIIRFTPVGLDDLEDLEDSPKIILTFDDSAQAVSDDKSFSIMEEFGFKGVTFLIVKSQIEWLSEEPLIDLLVSGWELGSHSWNHPRLDEIDDIIQLRHEIIDSKKWIEDTFDTNVISFSYPHSRGSDDSLVLQVLNEGGYLYAREGTWHRDWDGERSFIVNSWVLKHENYETYLSKLFTDARENGIAVAMFHRVNSDLNGWGSLTPEEFRFILQRIKDEGFEVITFKDLEIK